MSKSTTASRGGKTSNRSSASGRSANKSSAGNRSNSKSGSNSTARSGTRQGERRGASSEEGANRPQRSSEGSVGSRGGGEKYLQKFFSDQLKDIYYAEQKLVQALATMRDAATTEELRDAFDDHLHQTQRHARRLERVFENMGMRPEGKRCEAIEGIIREVEQIIRETEQGTITRDAALIMGAQKAEHYEIATYGGLVTFAITMGMYEEADLLDRTLVEEEITDSLLTDIAEEYINIGAELESEESYEGEGEEEGEGGEEEEERMGESARAGMGGENEEG